MTYQLTCEVCGDDFENRVQHAKYCSDECKKEAKRIQARERYRNKGKHQLTCQNCGEDFHSDREEAKYCSQECNYDSSRVEKKCKECGEVYKCPKHKDSGFCSNSCSTSYHNRRIKTKDPVILECKFCKEEFSVHPPSKAENKKYCSEECFGKDNQGENNPIHQFSGSHMPDDYEPWTKGKTAEENEKVAKVGEKISETLTEKYKEEEHHWSGKTHSKETKEKMSKIRKKAWQEGKHDNLLQSYESGEIYSEKMGRDIKYRSSWEKKVIQYLDQNNDVINFRHEPYSIEYQYDQKRHYIPDFLVTYSEGEQKLLEVKPRVFHDSKQNRCKFRAVKEHCEEQDISFEVWDKEIIKERIDD